MKLPMLYNDDMDAEADKLGKAVARIVQAMEPEAIYLFGFHARGDADVDSDYDLLVIVPDDSPTIGDR